MSIILADPPAALPRIPISTSTLASPHAPVGYAFTPSSDPDDATVTVVRTDKRNRDTYVLSVEDARTLWRFLRSKGFEVF